MMTPVRSLCLALLLASSASAASFDCTKASTVVEKAICATPRLSALDEELAATYAAVRKNPAVREGQRRWLVEERDACEDGEGCIEAAYLVRIATLRLASPALFARQKAPHRVLGRYSEMQEVCFPSEDDPNENECEGEVENFVDIRRGRGNALRVGSELFFFAGHQCSIETGPAEWEGDELRVAVQWGGEPPSCVLVLRFSDSAVTMTDPGGRCKDSSCGARGSFEGIELSKKP